MTKKKPDRFERMVLTEMKKQDTPSSTCIWLNGPDVVKVLRREHRAVVRMIRTMKIPPGEVADVLSRRGILDQLERRTK